MARAELVHSYVSSFQRALNSCEGYIELVYFLNWSPLLFDVLGITALTLTYLTETVGKL